MANKLKVYFKEYGYENPKFWPANLTNDYAVSLHMTGKDRWEEFVANVVFLLGEHGKNETLLLGQILEEMEEPIVLTVPLAASASQQILFKSLGLTLMPGRWTDKKEREEYEVYVKGLMNMGEFVNLMEKIVAVSDYVIIKRTVLTIFFSFIFFKFSRLLLQVARLFRV